MTTKSEHLVFLTNELGQRAKVCMLRILDTTWWNASALAAQHGFRHYDVVSVGPKGNQRTVARVRNDKLLCRN